MRVLLYAFMSLNKLKKNNNFFLNIKDKKIVNVLNAFDIGPTILIYYIIIENNYISFIILC